MKRLLHAIQGVLIAAAIALGAVWPSIYTLVGIVVLPGFFLAVAAFVKPEIVRGHGRSQWLRTYLYGCAVLSALALFSQVAWMLSTHRAPVDVIVEDGSAGPVLVIYAVKDGAPLREVGGRRVYEIPASRVLLAGFAPNDGWWSEGERQFFSRDSSGDLRPTPGMVGSAGTVSWSGCTASFEQFIIQPAVQVPDDVYRTLDDRESWGVGCVEGRLTKR